MKHIIIISLAILLISCENIESKNIKEQQLVNITNANVKALVGTYENKSQKDSISFAMVTIQYIKANTILFKLETGHIGGCIGFLEGEISLDSNLSGVYNTIADTELIFKFTETQLHIEEKEDSQEHGMRCWFKGWYIKNH